MIPADPGKEYFCGFKMHAICDAYLRRPVEVRHPARLLQPLRSPVGRSQRWFLHETVKRTRGELDGTDNPACIFTASRAG